MKIPAVLNFSERMEAMFKADAGALDMFAFILPFITAFVAIVWLIFAAVLYLPLSALGVIVGLAVVLLVKANLHVFNKYKDTE